MASTYSPLLRFELIAPGEQPGLWGNTANANLGNLLEQAIAGVTTVTLPNNTDYALSATNGTPDEARSAIVVIGGTPAGATNIVVPASQKWWIMRNGTSSTLTIKTSGQVGAPTLGPGNSSFFYCDGTSVYYGLGGQEIANGGTGATTAAGARTNLGVPALDGTGASGTWGISITGNADSVTDGVTTSDLSTTGGANKVTKLDGRGRLYLTAKPTLDLDSGAAFSNGFIRVSDTSPYGGAFIDGGNIAGTPFGVFTNWSTSSTKLQSGDALAYFQGGVAGGFLWTDAGDPATGAGAVVGSSTRMSLSRTALTLYRGATYATSSDARWKFNEERIAGALERVRRLTGYTYQRNDVDDKSKRHVGLIAQEVQKVLPEAVQVDEDGYLHVRYGEIAALLVEAIKDLDARLTRMGALK